MVSAARRLVRVTSNPVGMTVNAPRVTWVRIVSSREGGDTLAFSATSSAGAPEAPGLAPRRRLPRSSASPCRSSRRPPTSETAPWRMRRGWLVRRMLLAADLLALAGAFAVVEAFFHKTQLVGEIGVGVETLIFLGLLPLWVLAAKLYGLYDRDEESATHSTADEVVSVFHLVTVGVWIFYATSWLVGLSNPDQAKLATFWFLALVFVVTARSGSQVARAAAVGVRPERVDRGRGGSRAADRSQAPPAPGVPHQPPRVHRCRAQGSTQRPRRSARTRSPGRHRRDHPS